MLRSVGNMCFELVYLLLMAGGAPTPCGRPTQDNGPLVVSRESGAPADQVEGTPGRASLEKLCCRTPPQLHAGGIGQQQLVTK